VDEFRLRLTKLDDIVILILCALYVAVFIVGLIGNAVIAYFTSKNRLFPHHLQQNRMLINLCIADLMVIIVCCPTTIYTTISKVWTFGWLLCKLSSYLQGVAVTAGTLSLAALSLDRYLIVYRISTFRKMNRRNLSLILITTIWIIAISIHCPILYVKTTHELKVGNLEVAYCYEEWNAEITRRLYSISSLIIVYVLPCVTLMICHASISCTLCTIDRIEPRKQALAMSDIKSGTSFRMQTYCSHVSEKGTSSGRMASVVSLEPNRQTYTQTFRTRRRLANVLMGLTLCFVACWLPYNFASVYMDLNPNHSIASLLPFTLLLGHAHSAINPIVYWLLNKSARNKIQNVIRFRSSIAKQSHLMPVMCFRFNMPTSTSTDLAMMKYQPRPKQSSNMCLSY
ncbi:orexin receptor type 2-like, partial [Centruroides sculpturatus]|uniref:orexin receptor type 2-like n=1 Tax=Centruroides sculpturatus TaxID=218467 RepID=UPI000C6EDC08